MQKRQTPDEYRRNLPHIQPQGGMFFITFRLYGSIPVSEIENISNIYKNTNTTDILGKSVKRLKQEQQEDYFLAFDEYLDNNLNAPYYLSKPEIAQLVSDSLHFRDGRDYKLVCFCIMSNHVHMIIYNLQKPLDRIMKELKSFTGNGALKILKNMDSEVPASILNISAAGAMSYKQELQDPSRFWQPESFDRIVRDRNDMANKISYILNNPVKAGFVNYWKKWKWSYCRPEFLND